MNLWVLIFITFVKLSDGSYAFKAGKLPHQFSLEKECAELRNELKAVSPNSKGEAVCIKISKENTT